MIITENRFNKYSNKRKQYHRQGVLYFRPADRCEQLHSALLFD